MAPTCSDPRQIVISLNPARRQALLKLVDEITFYMSSQLEIPDVELGPVASTPRNESGPSTPKDVGGSSTPKNDDPNKPAQQPNKPSAEALRIQKAAIKHLEGWKKEFMPKLEEIVRVKDDHKIQDERRKHQEAMEKKQLDTPEEGENLISFGEAKVDKSEDIASLQTLYHPIPTRLTTIPAADRREILSCILLLLLSTGKYSAHTRALALYLASSLELPQSFIIKEEIEIAKTLLESSKDQDKQQEVMSAEAEASKRREDNKFSRFWKVGLASVAGAAVIGVTGGLAAPLVAGAVGGILGGVGLGGVASFLGVFWMNGALVGALFGAYGGKMTGEIMDKYAKEVEDFRFVPLKGEWGEVFNAEKDEAQAQARRLRVTIGINGWLHNEDDVTKPWRILNDDSEVFALQYEMKSLIALGHALRNMVESFAWKKLKLEILKRTVFATLLAALWPIQLLAAASNIDNPFGHAHNRSRKAGRLLADALINKVQGERPVTLVGYSLGATAIHACLQSLAERHAFGLIDSVVVIGAPAPSAPPHWRTLRTVVSGKIFNVCSENDLILGFVYRAHSLSMGVAGLQNIQEVEGIQNLDLSDTVSGHLRYPNLIGEILNKCGFIGIKAASEIEKDDLIKMKDRHAEGELIDFEGIPVEGQKSPQSPSQEEIEKDLHGLNISPPALAPPSQAPGQENPPLPRRPTAKNDDEPAPKLPRRPAASEAQPISGIGSEETSPPLPRRPTAPQKEEKPAIPRRPVGAQEANPPLPKRSIEHSHSSQPEAQQQRPWTPETNISDDEEYGHITMVNYDSDHSTKEVQRSR
ncbi:hypothetical protein F66182_3764 [Fusarium sp. NRRL 66182]|nr:hypothetical protein F66182_3764 [Fusarium sp. NRRL 66182]